jgi:hypothetical protein
VFFRNGRYREKLTVDRPRVTLLGESRDGPSDAMTPRRHAHADRRYGTRGASPCALSHRIFAPSA